MPLGVGGSVDLSNESFKPKGSCYVGSGLGHDHFVFAPVVGADPIINANPQRDAVELDNFAHVQSTQQLASLFTADAYCDAVIELGHSDSITGPGVSASYLQAHLQSLVHLH